MKRLSGVALIIYVALPEVKCIYNLIWIFFNQESLYGKRTHINTYSQIPRLSCIMHQRSRLGCTVVVVLTMVSNYPAFSTRNTTHAAGEFLPRDRLRLLRQSVPFSSPRRALSARVGGLEDFFFFLRITDVGCLQGLFAPQLLLYEAA